MKYSMVLGFAFLFMGCSSMQVQYHHDNVKENSFWMTVVSDESSDDEEWSLWRCKATDDKPVCTQAKLDRCIGRVCNLHSDDTEVRMLEGGQSVDMNIFERIFGNPSK